MLAAPILDFLRHTVAPHVCEVKGGVERAPHPLVSVAAWAPGPVVLWLPQRSPELHPSAGSGVAWAPGPVVLWLPVRSP